MSRRFLSTREVSELLGVSSAAVVRAARAGDLRPAGRAGAGDRLRFTDESVEAYRRRRAEATAAAGSAPLPAAISREEWLAQWDDLVQWLGDVRGAVDPMLSRPPAPAPTPVQTTTPAPPATPPAPAWRGLGGRTAELVEVVSIRPESERASREMAIAVDPISRFGLLRDIAGLLRGQPGVADVRLERLEGGVAWYRLHFQGAQTPATVIADTLRPLGLRVQVTR